MANEKYFTGSVIDALGHEYKYAGFLTNIGTEFRPYWRMDNDEQIDYMEITNEAKDIISINEARGNDLFNAIEFDINEEV